MGIGRLGAAIFLASALAGCGGAKLWPFGEPSATEVSRRPANATEYACEGGKVFYVRNLEGGAVWLIAPDREIRLEKAPGTAAGVFQAGKIRLEISGPNATLADPPARFAGCKQAAAKS